ncbi:NAD-dependent epimerase/dehydratase family protein [Paenibacillus eucommiae]|uniref:Nucleoside-diphosphate-sugar epimerase n=1 Tax=Paenibacillus eucommiae TaxID=1355755 RepID=A0ABS4J198_9BACL|nr:NAD(P)-dependent oxidoreductase [Paenibacillus eucommiae]MBP1993617.1 nucleoside-diphosphate-sugar epimerase [Paenibacillus eucommiae]
MNGPSMNKRLTIAVTGGAGTLGKQVIVELQQHGYEAVCLDLKPHPDPACQSIVVDLLNFEDVYEALEGCDAVIHLAAIPDPRNISGVFATNVVSTMHVLEAADKRGITKAVTASSESAYGFPWAIHPLLPQYFPVDEAHPELPQEGYGLSKVVNELTGAMFNRRSGMQVVCFRLSTICVAASYQELVREGERDPGFWKRILWSYIDVRDAAAACRLAIEAEGLGAVELNMAADNTFMSIPTSELMQTYFPEITDIRQVYEGNEAFYSNKKAKQLLGWQPVHDWRDQI